MLSRLNSLSRRTVLAMIAAFPLALGAAAGPVAAESVLRVVPDSDLKILDPIWTTTYITRDHAYMIYDTLFAMDENFIPQPQMVGDYSASDDRLTWTFTLRDGLMFHDGAPVTGEDVVASLTRWGARDGMGQQLFAAIDTLVATDEKTVVLTLSEPYGLVLEALGKLSSNVPVIMPKRIAETDPNEQITEYIGSGPFVFEADLWVPGSEVVYTKFEDYVPRDEPPSGAAGGKVVKVDKVVWKYFPDATTAMNALLAGEVDYFKQPASDLTPLMEANPDITVAVNDPIGSIGFARFNSILPPFDDPDVRRAAIMAMNQKDYLAAAIGDPKFWRTCYSVYPCGTPLENDAGSSVIETGDVAAAKAALDATGYDGTPVLIMHPTDVPSLSAFTLVTAQKLRDAGFTVELAAMDWSTLASRRASRKPVNEGGWNMFHTLWNGVDVMTPMSIAFSGDSEKGWFGWPEDAALEEARAQFPKALADEDKLALAMQVQDRLWSIGASGELGQFFLPIAYRNNVKGIIKSPLYFYWNISVD